MFLDEKIQDVIKMSRYQGGKNRLGGRIHRVIIKVEDHLTGGKKLTYFEPFVGMCGVLRKFGEAGGRKLIACDANDDIVQMWIAVQNGWEPPKSCTNKRRQLLRESPPSPEKTAIGFGTSFNGSWFLGKSILSAEGRDLAYEAHKGIMSVYPHVKEVEFISPGGSYLDFSPEACLVYCDPPYAKNNYVQDFFRGFDHDKFWETMDVWSKNNVVVVSESNAPPNWRKIWGKNCKVSVRWKKAPGKKSFEDNLYIHSSQYKKLPKSLLQELNPM